MGFKEVTLAAIGYVILYKRPLAKALLVPFVLFMLLDVTELFEPNLLVSIVTGVLALMVQTVFAITTHRMILLGPNSVPEWGLFKWSKRETFFALHVIGLGLTMVPIALLGLIPIVGLAIAIGTMCWVFARLSLVFPAIAIDQGVSFKLSWDLTKNRQLLMFLVVVVFPLALMIPANLLSFLPYSFLLTSLLATFATVFMVAALSVSYRLIYRETYES